MTGGYLEATGSGVDVTVNGTTTVSGASLYAESGATLTLPNLTSYTETDNTVFEATGPNSTLDLSALTTLGNMTNYWHVEALAGGTVNLSGLTTINEPNASVQFDGQRQRQPAQPVGTDELYRRHGQFHARGHR